MRRLLALAVVLVAVLAAPVAARAATLEDAFSLGPTATALRAQGVKLVPVPPAEITGPAWTLPVQQRRGKTVIHAGGLLLRRGSRTLVLTSLRTPASGPGSVTALVAGRRLAIARVSANSRVSLNAAFTRIVRRRLALPHTVSATFGVLRRSPVLTGAPVTPEPAAPSTPTSPGTGTTTSTPAALERPATAKDVAAATITWHIRDSFVEYLDGTGPLDGAVAAAPSGSPSLVREYRLPLQSGWYDPATGRADVRFTGGVRFYHVAHGLEIEARNLEVQLVPGSSLALADFSGAAVTKPGRGPLVNLTFAAPAVAPDTTATWAKLPGTIPAGADTSVFAGFYFPGDDFGWLGVTLRPAP